MKLHRDLNVTQKTAWFLAHRIRKTFAGESDESDAFTGPVEVDETYMGGKRANMSKAKREELTGRGPVGKTAIVGAKDRTTNQVTARVVESTDGPTLRGFVTEQLRQMRPYLAMRHRPMPHSRIRMQRSTMAI